MITKLLLLKPPGPEPKGRAVLKFFEPGAYSQRGFGWYHADSSAAGRQWVMQQYGKKDPPAYSTITRYPLIAIVRSGWFWVWVWEEAPESNEWGEVCP